VHLLTCHVLHMLQGPKVECKGLSGGLARAQATAVVAPEDAIRTLQSMLPPAPARPLPPVELENVSPSLLLPPAESRREAVG